MAMQSRRDYCWCVCVCKSRFFRCIGLFLRVVIPRYQTYCNSWPPLLSTAQSAGSLRRVHKHFRKPDQILWSFLALHINTKRLREHGALGVPHPHGVHNNNYYYSSGRITLSLSRGPSGVRPFVQVRIRLCSVDHWLYFPFIIIALVLRGLISVHKSKLQQFRETEA